MDWDDFYASLQRLNSVALRIERGQALVDQLAENEGLEKRSGQRPDMEETKVIPYKHRGCFLNAI